MEDHQGGLIFSVSHGKSGPCWASRWRCPWGSWMLGLKLQKLWTGDQSLRVARTTRVQRSQGVGRQEWGGRGETLRRETEEGSQGEIGRAHERKATEARKETFEKNCNGPGC